MRPRVKKTDWYHDGCSRTCNRKEQLSDRLDKVLTIFSRYKFSRILDIGCGDGKFSLFPKQAAQAQEVCGVDISRKAVQQTDGVESLYHEKLRGSK